MGTKIKVRTERVLHNRHTRGRGANRPHATTVWTHWVDNRKAGGQTRRGRLQYHDRSHYTPHQGAQEIARRKAKTRS